MSLIASLGACAHSASPTVASAPRPVAAAAPSECGRAHVRVMSIARDGAPFGVVAVVFIRDGGPPVDMLSDQGGNATVDLPADSWRVHAMRSPGCAFQPDDEMTIVVQPARTAEAVVAVSSTPCACTFDGAMGAAPGQKDDSFSIVSGGGVTLENTTIVDGVNTTASMAFGRGHRWQRPMRGIAGAAVGGVTIDGPLHDDDYMVDGLNLEAIRALPVRDTAQLR